jgi:MoxR-like ATPase
MTTQTTESTESEQALRGKFKALSTYLNHKLIGCDEMIEAAIIAVLANDNLYIQGPPGTGKSQMARLFAGCFKHSDGRAGGSFEVQFSADTTKDEILGPWDLKKLFPQSDEQPSRYVNLCDMTSKDEPRFAPQADVLILDEPANGSSGTLKSLHNLLDTHRTFWDGETRHDAHTQVVLGTANEMLPADCYALDSRYGVRVRKGHLSYADSCRLNRILATDGEAGKGVTAPSITFDELRSVQALVRAVPRSVRYMDSRDELDLQLRNANIEVDQRNWEKLLVLVCAYAWFTGADQVNPSHLYFARHVCWKNLIDADIVEDLVTEIAAKDQKEIRAQLKLITREYDEAPRRALKTPGAAKANAVIQCKAALEQVCVYVLQMEKRFEASPVLEDALKKARGIRKNLVQDLGYANVPIDEIKKIAAKAKLEVA